MLLNTMAECIIPFGGASGAQISIPYVEFATFSKISTDFNTTISFNDPNFKMAIVQFFYITNSTYNMKMPMACPYCVPVGTSNSDMKICSPTGSYLTEYIKVTLTTSKIQFSVTNSLTMYSGYVITVNA